MTLLVNVGKNWYLLSVTVIKLVAVGMDWLHAVESLGFCDQLDRMLRKKTEL